MALRHRTRLCGRMARVQDPCPTAGITSRPLALEAVRSPRRRREAAGEAGPLTMQHDTLPPPSPETWQSTEPVDRWTRNTRGFEQPSEERVPDFDEVMEQAMRDAG